MVLKYDKQAAGKVLYWYGLRGSDVMMCWKVFRPSEQ